MINKERKGKKEKQNERNSITTMYSNNYSDFNLEPKHLKNLKKLMHQPYCLFETYNISHEYYVAKVYFHKANKIIYGCFYPNIILFVTTCNKIGYI